ncbi:hypothetical protein Tco_1530697 [Tanacetum coccineum]
MVSFYSSDIVSYTMVSSCFLDIVSYTMVSFYSSDIVSYTMVSSCFLDIVSYTMVSFYFLDIVSCTMVSFRPRAFSTLFLNTEVLLIVKMNLKAVLPPDILLAAAPKVVVAIAIRP